MQKYWTPFRELESFSENLSNPPKPATGSEMNRFRSNHTESISSEMKWIAEAVSVKNVILNKILNTKPQVRTLTTNAKNLMESNKGTSSHGNKQHGFVTAVAYDNNLQPNRKRPSLEAIEEGPARKKNQSSNDNSVEKNVQTKSANGQDETKKNLKAKNPTPSKLVDQRCLTGDVAQVLKLNKSFPNVNAFYEVYAKVLKADSTKERKKTLLLRNNFGPVLQGVFYEIDFKMVDVKAVY
ncbi:hypothetical protein Bhyg_15750 [Pseudolycoriella hygida]|uniref:Uncharacterized protein n=1 Tax=Pseudolycoriella hygida TaxID=35572 RepID=A0A9Q0MJH1_9DIPT|nr:hypothetical protein Bhyg_15750 [Pseudolycoriella hygida]